MMPSILDDFEESEKEDRRPLSPVNEAVVRPPRTLDDALKILLPRMQPQKGISGLTVEDQQAFVRVIIGEVAGYWQNLEKPIAYPFLTLSENRELHRMVAVEFLSVAVSLFNSYIAKPLTLQQRKVFDSTANATRLKALLAVEANRELNVSLICRRCLTLLKSDSTIGKSRTTSVRVAVGAKHEETVSEEVERRRAIANEIKDLTQRMPTITSFRLAEVESHKQEQQRSSESHQLHKGEEELEKEMQHFPRLVKEESSSLLVAMKDEHEIEKAIEGSLHGFSSMDIASKSEGEDHLLDGDVQDTDVLRKIEAPLTCKKPMVKSSTPVVETARIDDLPILLQAVGQWSGLISSRKSRDSSRHRGKDDEKSQMYEKRDDDNDESQTDEEKDDGMENFNEVSLRDKEKKDDTKNDVSSSNEEITTNDKSHVQPAVVTTRIPDLYKHVVDVVRMSDVRVSERIPKSCLLLKPCGLIYNELLGEISPEEVKLMDRNLYRGEEIKHVYEEIMQTVEDEHLIYDKDEIIEPTAEGKININDMFSSVTLHHRRSRRIINADLRHAQHPPWSGKDQQEWIMSNQYNGPLPSEYMKTHSLLLVPSEMLRISRQYEYWRLWWKSTINTDDFLKFVARKESDYLHHIFHLYESEGDDSEDEEIAEQRKAEEEQRKSKARERQKKVEQLKIKKQGFTKGMWNVNTIAMGGLGEEPELEGEESDQDSDEESKDVSHQDRFEAIWASLKMPEHQRLDMVIKHSTNDRGHVGQALDLWESAAQAVVKRESIISELELFERQASDPGRFFEKGTVGSSSYRLAEAKGREKLYKRLEPLEAAAQATVLLVQDKLGDTVTYEGRPYIEKIRFDRVEMLYWLQQERRREALVSKDLPPLVASKSNI